MSDDVGDAVRQWVAKAQGDWKAAQILSEYENAPREAICFHCQQCVEKLLKGALTRHNMEAPRTHDLRRLIQLCELFLPELRALADRSDRLSTHGVQSRYPDEWREVTAAEAARCMELAQEFQLLLHPLLGNPSSPTSS